MDTVSKLLNELVHTGKQVRLFYGDKETGRDWGEENYVTGTIGRSTGIKPIHLLINNSRSYGGLAILEDCIVKLMVNKRVVYVHPLYNQPEYVIKNDGQIADLPFEVYANDVITARFNTRNKADRWVAFMTGKRFCK